MLSDTVAQGGLVAAAVTLAVTGVELAKLGLKKMNGGSNSDVGFHIRELRKETSVQTELIREMRDLIRDTLRG